MKSVLDHAHFDRLGGSNLWTFFCPLCRTNRVVTLKPKFGTPRHWLQLGITAATFTAVCWPLFSWKGVVSFFLFWAIFELAYRLRVRAELSCRQCGFDPYLYLTDIPRARKEIEAHWRRKFAEKGIPFPEPQVASKGALTGSPEQS